MTFSSRRVVGILKADLLIRLRRTSTLVLLLLMCVTAYFMVADPATGQTLMQVNEARVLYNSAAIAMATAVLASFLIGIFGFYLVSNAVERDLETRAGFVLAGTPMSNLEYLTGKFVGNAAYLATVTLGYLGSVLVMHLLRGEASLQPGVYLGTYLAVLGPPILFVSGVALFFECCRPLSGRAGDVIYFFLWAMVLGLAAAMSEGGDRADWISFLDVFGLRFILGSINSQMPEGARGLSIGHSSFDPSRPPFVIHGIVWSLGVVLDRLAACVASILMLFGAMAFFHRFDPARVRGPRHGSRGALLPRVNAMLKFLTRPLGPLAALGSAPRGPRGFAGQVWSDALLTFMLSPLALLALVVVIAAACLLPLPTLRTGLLPAVFYVLILALPEIPTRDQAAGTLGLLHTTPMLRRQYLWWKLGASVLVTLAFLLIPLLRLLVSQPSGAGALLAGALFTAGLATALGLLTGSPKAFAGVFLFFLYLVQSSGGASAFDFAGWYGRATPMVSLAYLVMAAMLLIVAWAWHRYRDARC